MSSAPLAAAPRVDRRRQRTRSAILSAGQRLFAARAPEGVTIDDIVAEADVAKGSFYNHFDDKDGLADAILAAAHDECEALIGHANHGVDDPAARVARALCVMVAYAADHSDRLKALNSLSERRRDADSPLNAGVARDVADGLAAGRFAGVSLAAGLAITIALIGTAVLTPAAPPAMFGAALLRALGVGGDAAPVAEAAARDLLAAAR